MATAEQLRRARERQSIFSGIYDAARQNAAELQAQGRRPVWGGLLSKEPVRGTDTVRWEGNVAGLLEPMARAIDAPVSAMRGLLPQEDIPMEAMGTAGLAALGGASMPKVRPKSAAGQKMQPRPAPREEVQGLFPVDVYHYSKSRVLEGDKFDPSYSMQSSVMDSLGTHVGTKKAAEDRFRLYDAKKEGVTLPLKARMDNPFLLGDSPFTETQLNEFINAYADNIGVQDRAELTKLLRKDLTDAGYTHIPYMNDIEDAGSLSAIMLTDRTAGDPAVLRSRFAAFQDAYDPRITAANASPIGGVMSLHSGDNEQKVRSYLTQRGLLDQ